MPQLTKTQLFEIERFLRMISEITEAELIETLADVHDAAGIFADLVEPVVDRMRGEIDSADLEVGLTPEQMDRIRRQMETDRELDDEDQ